MKIPPFYISASLLFWGWQTDLVPVALVMIFLLEAPWIIKSKWDFSIEDFHRVTDFCAVLLAGKVIYVIATQPQQIIHGMVKWLPVIVFLLMAAQKYSVTGKINIRSLMLLARKDKIRRLRDVSDVDVSYPYSAICIISAGIGNIRTHAFYICVLLLACWGLFPFRSRRYSMGTWSILLVLAGAGGYAGHQGISRLQAVVTNMAIGYLAGSDTDPFNRATAIGDIGLMKQSNRIVFRVKKKTSDSIYLREASYNQFNRNSWYATRSEFQTIDTGVDGTSWQLSEGQGEGGICLYTPVQTKVRPC